MSSDDREMTLVEHLHELRNRLFVSVVAVSLGFGVCLWQAEALFALLTAPLDGQKLVFVTPTEGVFTQFRIAAYAGIFLASPIWLYEIWSFVAPALKQRERHFILGLAATSALLFAAGVAVCWTLLPPMMKFLLSVSSYLTPMLTVGSYLSFLLWFCLAFGLIFQMPIVVVFLVRARLVSLGTLWRGQRWALVGSVVLAAVITPTPDLVNQAVFAGPIMALYEISLLAAWLLKPSPVA